MDRPDVGGGLALLFRGAMYLNYPRPLRDLGKARHMFTKAVEVRRGRGGGEGIGRRRVRRGRSG